LEPYRRELKGKTAFITGGEIRIITTAELLNSLGLEILGLRGFHFDVYGEKLLEEYLAEVPDSEKTIINIGTGQPFEQANLLANYKPDVYVGHPGGNGWASKQGIPVFPLFGQQYDYMGYLGVFEVARRLARTLRNTSYSKNISKHAELPYRKDWYSQDPFSYIDENIPENIAL